MSGILDEIYSDVLESVAEKKKEIKQMEREFKTSHPKEDTDKERMAIKITQRMIYLNRTPKTAERETRIDELSKLLDWIDKL